MTKITLNMWMWEPFHDKSGVIISWENVCKNNYVQMYKVLKQNNLFLSQSETSSKRNRSKFMIALGDILYKVGFV